MPITGADLTYLRRRVGSAPDDAALTLTYDGYVESGVKYPLEWVILEVLEIRLADMIRNPAQFSVSGEYGQNTGKNIDAMLDLIKGQRAYMIGLGLDVPGPSDGGVFSIIDAAPPRLVR